MTSSESLARADLRETPLAQFEAWLGDATDAGLTDPNAMVLATASADGQPSARSVLLKGADARGFSFFTNLGSRKGAELAENPRVSLDFPWYTLHRQVVVVGSVELLPREEVAAYFATRPHGSQIGAWASRQSQVIEEREVLEDRVREFEERYPDGTDVPLPDFWGGWLVRPRTIEFWQGRRSRLHDRLRFRATQAQAQVSLDSPADWIVERLSP